MVKYKLEGEVSEAAVSGFVREFEAQRLMPHLKSEAPPTSQPGPVHVLVGSTFDAVVKDPTKDVLVEFYAPWCGHCKALKPAWDKLIDHFKDSKTALVADVDCTGDGKPLCEEHGVQGFPTIKYGDPSSLEDYEGGREYDELETFASENLKPMCSPKNIDLCDAEKKAQIEGYQKMSAADLDAEIEKKDAEFKEAEETFDAEVQKLQEKYEQLEKEKTEKQAAVKASGLSLMKAVKAAKGSSDSEEL